MAFSAQDVKELREMTGCGMMDCKKALTETDGNMEAAVEVLKKSGAAKMEKKASRIAAEGVAKVATEGNTAVVVEVNSETDFVSKNEEFTSMIDTIGNTILASDAKTVEEALELSCEEGTINDLIVAKTAKPAQDQRFDIPGFGTKTMESMITAGATGIVIEAGNTLIVERDKTVALADKHNITILVK